VQKVVDEVFQLFSPMARREWLVWGGELLFPDLSDQVERERQEEEVRRVREQEEEAKRAKEDAKKAKIEARRGALAEARNALLAAFCAKTVPKEELQRRNAELAAEAEGIMRAEAGEEDDEELEDELPVARLRKRKALVAEDEEDGEDEVEEVEVAVKRAKFAHGELLEFAGAVSARSCFEIVPINWFAVFSATGVLASSRSQPVSSRTGPRSARSAPKRHRGVTGRGSRERE